MSVEITRARPDRVPALASVLGRAFVSEPMLRWPLGPPEDDLEQGAIRQFGWFLEDLVELGTVWEAGDELGAVVWIGQGQADVWKDAQMNDQRVYELLDDGGRRWDSFWAWIDSKIPEADV